MIARELERVLHELRPRRPSGTCSVRETQASSPTSTPATREPAGRRSGFRELHLLRGPGLRRRPAGSGLGPRFTPRRRGGLARARLWPRRVHASLLRRVPRSARQHRPRGAFRAVFATAGYVRRQVQGDRALDGKSRALPASERARWTARAVVHHSGRRACFSALGSRAESAACPHCGGGCR